MKIVNTEMRYFITVKGDEYLGLEDACTCAIEGMKIFGLSGWAVVETFEIYDNEVVVIFERDV